MVKYLQNCMNFDQFWGIMKEKLGTDFDFSIVRHLRLQKKLSLQKLADLTGISYATLSRIEANHYQPSLQTLKKLANFFEISPAHLLELTTSFIVERSEEKEMKLEPLNRRGVDFSDVTLRFGTGKPGKAAEKTHQHPDCYQITWVLKGTMIVTIHEEQFKLSKGQSIKFDATFSHRVKFLTETDFFVVLIPKIKR